MFNTTREHTALGPINWRAMKRIHKRGFKANASVNLKGGIKAAKKTLMIVAKDASADKRHLRESRLYLRNLVNWL